LPQFKLLKIISLFVVLPQFKLLKIISLFVVWDIISRCECVV